MDFKQEITRLKRVVYFLNRTSTTIINNLVTTLSALTDVSIYEPDGGQVLMYNESTQKWENEQINQAHVIQGAGVSVTQRPKLNFVGATVADDPSAGATKVTITGGSGGGTWGSITGTLSNQTDLQAALNLKANLASPTFTGTPAAPTAANGTNTTQLATTAFVQTAVSSANPNNVGGNLFLYYNFY